MSDQVYDFLRKLEEIVLPALAVMYMGLSKIWGLPYAEEVSASTVVVVTFLGAIVAIANEDYKRKRRGDAE